MKRREFLKYTAGLGAAVAMSKLINNFPQTAGATGGHQDKANPAVLPQRAYGKTGVKLSIIGLGGIVVSKAEQKHARRVVAKAIEKGVNYFDVAPTYDDAELKLGPALEPYRKKVFLACKTTQRQRAGAEAELKSSLKRLRTDYLDLYQLHALTGLKKDVDAAFGKGGAMEAFVEAKKAGMVRHLGFSAHSVEAALAAMDRYDFDSVLFPVNAGCYYSGNFGRQVIDRAKSKNVAVLALKALAKQPWQEGVNPGRKQFPKCWYEPLWDREEAQMGLQFALSEPITAVLPPGEEKLFWLAVDLAMKFEPLKPDQTNAIKKWAGKLKPIFKYEPEDKR